VDNERLSPSEDYNENKVVKIVSILKYGSEMKKYDLLNS